MMIEDLDLDLELGTYNCIKRAGLNFVSDIRKMTDEDLLKIRNMGKNRLKEIKEKMSTLYSECLCEQGYIEEKDIIVVRNEFNNEWELRVWNPEGYDEDGCYESDEIITNSLRINYCPICGKKLD